MSDKGKAKEMKDALEKDLKEHDWSYKVKELKDGRWAIDTDVVSRSDVFKNYEIRLVCNKWDMTVVVYHPVKAPVPPCASFCVPRTEMTVVFMSGSIARCAGWCLSEIIDGVEYWRVAGSGAESGLAV